MCILTMHAKKVIRLLHAHTHTGENLNPEVHGDSRMHIRLIDSDTHTLRLCRAGEATHYLSLSVKEEEVLCNVCRLSSEARERGSARERGGATPRESGGGCWEQLRS